MWYQNNVRSKVLSLRKHASAIPTSALPASAQLGAVVHSIILSAERKAYGPKPRRLGAQAAYSSLYFTKEVKAEADKDWSELEAPNGRSRLAHNNRAVRDHYTAASDEVKAEVARYIEERYEKEMQEYMRVTSALQSLNSETL